MRELTNLIEEYLKENEISDDLIHHAAFKKDLPRELSIILERDLISLLDTFNKEEGYRPYIEKFISVMDGKILMVRNAYEFNTKGSLLYVFGMDDKKEAFKEKIDKFSLPVKYGDEKVSACHYSTEKRMYDYTGIENRAVFGRAFKLYENDLEAENQAKKLEFLDTDEIVFNSEKNRNGFRYTLYMRRPDMITMDIYGKFLNKDSKDVDAPKHVGIGLIDDKHPELLIPSSSLNDAYNFFLTRVQNASINERVNVSDIKGLNFDFDELKKEEKEEIVKKFEKSISKINNSDIKETMTCRMIMKKLYSENRRQKLISEKVIDEEGNLL